MSKLSYCIFGVYVYLIKSHVTVAFFQLLFWTDVIGDKKECQRCLRSSEDK
ncbi:MAG: hypothetical protein ACPLW9_02910 [Minisyncoccales bacterium]